MTVNEISMQELEVLVRKRLPSRRLCSDFSIHRLKQGDDTGCNWCLLTGTLSHAKRRDLETLKDFEDTLETVKRELQKHYNLSPNEPTHP